MPAAAVIAAPIAYIKVAAVKKVVVGSQSHTGGPAIGGQPLRPFYKSNIHGNLTYICQILMQIIKFVNRKGAIWV